MLVARYGELEIDDEAFNAGLVSLSRATRHAQSFGAGLNWNLNKNVRALFDFDHTEFDGGLPGEDRPHENVFLTRLQLGFEEPH